MNLRRRIERLEQATPARDDRPMIALFALDPDDCETVAYVTVDGERMSEEEYRERWPAGAAIVLRGIDPDGEPEGGP